MASLPKDLVKFNSNTSARDKIFRTVQYGSRLILYQLTHGSKDVPGEVILRLQKLEAALGLSRKLFRLGNVIDLFYKTLDALSISHPGMMLLALTTHSMKGLWLFMDHIIWFGKVGVAKLDLPFWTQWSLRAWLVAMAAAAMSSMLKIQAVDNRLAKFRKENGQDARIPASLQIELRSARMNFWRDFCDFFIPMGGLGYASPGFAALCGVVSSLIGFRQEWERHITPYKPAA